MESKGRLKLFAEIYQTKMDAKPFLTVSACYNAMTEAKLAVSERELAEEYVDTGRLQELLDPVPDAFARLKAIKSGPRKI